jgi:integrase/recombinase XerC
VTALALIATPNPILLPMARKADVFASFLDGRKQSTLEAYQDDLRDFARFLYVEGPEAAVEALVSCDHGDANRVALAYRAQMTERGLAAATIARRLATLRSMVKVARQIGRVNWCLDVESPKSEPYRDTRGPGLDGWRKMKAAGRCASTAKGKRDLALIHLMHDLGLRRGECVAMDLGDVDLEAAEVAIIGKGKTEKIRLTLSRPALEALRDWLSVRPAGDGPLFVRLDRAANGTPGRLTGDSVCSMVHALGRAAGLSRATRPHGLRHAGITRALDLTGGDVRKVQRFSRHAKLETLLLYDDARRDDAGGVAKMLGEDE